VGYIFHQKFKKKWEIKVANILLYNLYLVRMIELRLFSRIHGDRSFHCDICGVCLDVQLRGNHKCRPDSAHDECFICSEVNT
jgi:hypothetical protein